MLKRALLELGLLSAPRPAPALRAHLSGAKAKVGLEGPRAIEDLPHELDRIDLEGGALGLVVARAARVGLLSDLGVRLALGGSLAIGTATTIAEGVSPWGRLFLDAPRALLTRVGLPEPGTRFVDGRLARAHHMYYASTELALEAWEGGLVERDHRAAVMTFARRTTSDVRPPRARFEDDISILAQLVRAERLRRRAPSEAFAIARRSGEKKGARDPAARRRLHARIAWLDGFVPPRPNCLRRVLAETLLDRGAAREPVVLSLDVGSTGHAHFPSDPQGPPKPYDVAFEV